MNSTQMVHTTIIRSLLSLADGLSIYGGNKQDFYARLGINKALLKNPLAQIPYSLMLDAWDLACELTNDPCLAIKLGLQAHPADYNVLGQIMSNSHDLGSAIKSAASFQKLITNCLNTSRKLVNSECVYQLELADNLKQHKGAHCIVERQYASWISVTNYLTNYSVGEKIKINRIEFRHQALTDVSTYARLYNCPVSFEKPQNAMFFDASILSIPVYAPDNELLDSALSIANQRLTKIEQQTLLSQKIKSYILENFQMRFPNSNDVATNFNMSVSSLKRKLKNEQTSFQEIIITIKKELAAELLESSLYPVSQIAYLLGYYDNSGFNSAFKRWFNMTPYQYREKMTSERE